MHSLFLLKNRKNTFRRKLKEDDENGRGFTLTEILVVIFIISLLGTVTFVNYRQGGEIITLQRAAYKLAQDIRRAQEMAIAAEKCELCGGIIPETGYGVVLSIVWVDSDLNNKKYQIYADVFGKNEFFNPGKETIVETIELESGIIIKEISSFSNLYERVSINFKPPDPKMKIKHEIGPPKSEKTLITLSLETDSSKTKTIEVNIAGLIEIH